MTRFRNAIIDDYSKEVRRLEEALREIARVTNDDWAREKAASALAGKRDEPVGRNT